MTGWLLLAVLALAQTASPPRDTRDAELKGGTAVVSGRVTDADTGAPMAGVTMSLVLLRTRAQVDTKTATGGVFRFDRLPPGSYGLTADPVGSATHRAAGYGAGAGWPPGKHSAIVLREGEVFDKADIELARTFVISARVVDENGEPVADMMVRADSVDGMAGSTRSRTTDDRGAVRLWGYSPGTYRVCAVPNPVPAGSDGEGFVRTCYPAATSDAEAQPVGVTNGDPAEVEIRIRRSRYFSISGVVLDPNGRVAAGAAVSFVTVDRSGGTVRSIQNDGGHFSVRGLTPGDYFIRADLLDGKQSRANGYAVARLQSADVENLVVALAPPTIVRGQLVFEGGPPPDPTAVSIRAEAARGSIATVMGRSNERTTIKSDLSFEFEGFLGPCTLHVSSPNWIVRSIRYGGEERINVPTEFKSHIDPSALQVVLTNRPAMVFARVLDDRGQPLDDAHVIIFPADPRQWDSGALGVSKFGMPSDGRYVFAGLRPAEYLIAVIPDGTSFREDDRRPLELLSKLAERITLQENDQRTIDLTVRR